jgi:hypothetical protein
LAVKAGVIGDPLRLDDKTYDYSGSTQTLPKEVQDWIGLSHQEGRFEAGSTELLTGLNDSGKRFKTIARIIESEPEGLFVA